MRLNLPRPTVTWVKESVGDWSLRTRGEDPIEVARVEADSDDGDRWVWITFWPSTCPDGAPEIASGWTSSVREGKLRAKEALIKAGAMK